MFDSDSKDRGFESRRARQPKTPENGEIPGFSLVFGVFGAVKICPYRADFARYTAWYDVKNDVKKLLD